MSFATLSNTYQMHTSQLYKYIQLKHAWRAEGLENREKEEFAPLEGKLLGAYIEKKAVSTTDKTLNNNMPDSLIKLRSNWESDIGRWRT